MFAGDGVDVFLVFMKLKRPLKGGGGKWSKRKMESVYRHIGADGALWCFDGLWRAYCA